MENGEITYQEAYVSQNYQAAKRSNDFGIASMICGISGLFLPILPSLAAVILGAFSFSFSKRAHTKKEGTAIAGILTGIIGLVFALLAIIWIICTVTKIVNNAMLLGNGDFLSGLRAYAGAFNESFSDWLGGLLRDFLMGSIG